MKFRDTPPACLVAAVSVTGWLLATGPAMAQQADPAPENEHTSEAAAPVQAPAPEQPDSPAAVPAPKNNNDSPFDYQSSEEISEDLSVSFPVDI